MYSDYPESSGGGLGGLLFGHLWHFRIHPLLLLEALPLISHAWGASTLTIVTENSVMTMRQVLTRL